MYGDLRFGARKMQSYSPSYNHQIMSKYKSILFDLDGTLLDTLDDLADSTNAVLKRHGLPTHPVDAYRYFVGDGARNLIIRALPQDRRNEPTISQLLAEYRDVYAKRWDAKSKPYAGVPELLDALVQRGDVKLAVLSNKPDDFTQLCVSRLLPKWKFDVVLGATDRFPHKPDPGAAIDIARGLKIEPARFLYVGDTATDMRTAIAAKMHPVGALWGFRTEQELREAGAQAILQQPLQLLDLFGN
jgi:phosphoglycolate phosphatase